DADADVPPLRVLGRAPRNVDPGLDRQRHPGLENRLRLSVALQPRDTRRITVAPRVVHVQPDPVTRAMRVELLIGPAAENFVAVAGQDSELKETVDHHSNRRVVHFVEGGTPTD